MWQQQNQTAYLALALQASGLALRQLRYGIWNLRHERLDFGHAQPGNQG